MRNARDTRNAARDRSISINPFRVSRVVSTRELFDALRAVKWLLPYSLALANQPSSDIYTLQRRVALCTEREKGKEREGQKRSSSRSILASISRKKFRKKSKSDRRELLQSDESEGEENTRAESVQKVLRYAKEIERCLRARVRASA